MKRSGCRPSVKRMIDMNMLLQSWTVSLGSILQQQRVDHVPFWKLTIFREYICSVLYGTVFTYQMDGLINRSLDKMQLPAGRGHIKLLNHPPIPLKKMKSFRSSTCKLQRNILPATLFPNFVEGFNAALASDRCNKQGIRY